jgi:Glutaredoxin
VPTFVMLRRGDISDRLEGYDPVSLAQKTSAFMVGESSEAVHASEGQGISQRLDSLVRQQPVMLFMKGEPGAPRCGFSRKVVDALQKDGIPFGHFDILSDDEVCCARQPSAWTCCVCSPASAPVSVLSQRFWHVVPVLQQGTAAAELALTLVR